MKINTMSEMMLYPKDEMRENAVGEFLTTLSDHIGLNTTRSIAQEMINIRAKVIEDFLKNAMEKFNITTADLKNKTVYLQVHTPQNMEHNEIYILMKDNKVLEKLELVNYNSVNRGTWND